MKIFVTVTNGQEFELCSGHELYDTPRNIARRLQPSKTYVSLDFLISKDNQIIMPNHVVSIRSEE